MKREPMGKARYEGIAEDLARRIAHNELVEGARLLGRSSLAGTYQVSPETVRRAVAILHERGVVQAVAGSGIRVVSRVAAQEYLDSIRTQSRLEEGAKELRGLLRQRRQLDEQIETALDRLLSQAAGALATRHVEEIVVSDSSWTVGRSLGEIRLRSSTGATAVALTRGESDHFSPPADMRLAAGDVLTVIGSEADRNRARELLAASCPPEVLN